MDDKEMKNLERSLDGVGKYLDRMVITVPDSAPLLELQQSTDPIGVQLSFDETSYKLMFSPPEPMISML